MTGVQTCAIPISVGETYRFTENSVLYIDEVNLDNRKNTDALKIITKKGGNYKVRKLNIEFFKVPISKPAQQGKEKRRYKLKSGKKERKWKCVAKVKVKELLYNETENYFTNPIKILVWVNDEKRCTIIDSGIINALTKDVFNCFEFSISTETVEKNTDFVIQCLISNLRAYLYFSNYSITFIVSKRDKNNKFSKIYSRTVFLKNIIPYTLSEEVYKLLVEDKENLSSEILKAILSNSKYK